MASAETQHVMLEEMGAFTLDREQRYVITSYSIHYTKLYENATVNRLLCGACGDYHTRLLSGDEMILASVELNVDAAEQLRDAG